MKRLAVAATSAALLVPSVASAAPADFRGPSPKPAPVIVAGPSHSGFDWGDAGVGAGATAALVLIGVGGYAAAYRGRIRLAR
jgi:hypothetical protein